MVPGLARWARFFGIGVWVTMSAVQAWRDSGSTSVFSEPFAYLYAFKLGTWMPFVGLMAASWAYLFGKGTGWGS